MHAGEARGCPRGRGSPAEATEAAHEKPDGPKRTHDGGCMIDLARIAKIPNVASAVLGDLSGGFFDAIREADGEAVAAVTGFISTSIGNAGEQLGLGVLSRVSLAGPTRGCIIAIDGGNVVTLGVTPPGSLPAVERALDSFPNSRG